MQSKNELLDISYEANKLAYEILKDYDDKGIALKLKIAIEAYNAYKRLH